MQSLSKFISCKHPFANRLPLPARVRLTDTETDWNATPPINWDRAKVTKTLDRLSYLVQAVVYVNSIPVVLVQQLRQVSVTMPRGMLVVVRSIKPHTDHIKAVKRVEHLRPGTSISTENRKTASVETVTLRT
jgi:hypothetical protein